MSDVTKPRWLSASEGVIEGLAFFPVAYTWIALGFATEAAGDPLTGERTYATFLDGWRSGFGQEGAWWALDTVAIIDGTVIGTIGLVFIMLRLFSAFGTKPIGSRSPQAQLDGLVAAINSASQVGAAAIDSAKQAANQTSAAVIDLRSATVEASQNTAERVSELDAAANRLAEAASNAQSLYDPIEGIARSLETSGTNLEGVSASIDRLSVVASETQNHADTRLNAYGEAFEEYRTAYQRYAAAVNRQAEMQTRLWEKMSTFTANAEQISERTLSLSRDLGQSMQNLTQTVDQLEARIKKSGSAR